MTLVVILSVQSACTFFGPTDKSVLCGYIEPVVNVQTVEAGSSVLSTAEYQLPASRWYRAT